MDIRSEARIAHPQRAVFEAYRDHLPEAARFIPDVREIVVRKREESNGRVSLHNEWASDREIPSVASAFLKPEHLRWDDFAVWTDADSAGDWQIKTRVFTDRVTCRGRTAILADGPKACRVVLTGQLRIEITELPGVPSFLAKRLGPQVEKFIVTLITPNLESTNRGIAAWLDSRG